ncbi:MULTISPECIES: ComEA family DNA-binding protein [Streptomyces]|uniref:ComEA family DNA-binding protein n=1 Tax=Streptomyces edwardsiae TaxID=3075527 RepID=A0ABU2QKC7_9ACTN|nr:MULTISPECIES: ComEA family DNA-binding protein [unclassified Streptomyces]MDT0404903.1 ComEA family DNA-binding protein [Streptomyces sp. DSM 41635]
MTGGRASDGERVAHTGRSAGVGRAPERGRRADADRSAGLGRALAVECRDRAVDAGLRPADAGVVEGGGGLAGTGAFEGASGRRPPADVSGMEGEGARAFPGRGRVGPALRERLPVWVQARCGLERRSVVALSALLVLAVGFAVQHFWTGRTEPVRAPEVVRAAVPHGDTAAKSVGASSAAPEIVVDVGGKVREPGIHHLPAGSRVEDALRAAGGVRPGTRTDALNRARFLVDGEQVVVGGPAPAGTPSGGGAGPPGTTGTAAGAGPTTPVSLNTATPDQLDALPGVGPVLARHIVEYRTRNSGFRSVDELREVNGIGDRRFADLRALVRL